MSSIPLADPRCRRSTGDGSISQRMRASAGQLILIAALTAVAGALLTGAPRMANKLEDESLRARIESLPFQIKDITYRLEGSVESNSAFGPSNAEARLGVQQRELNPVLSQRIGQSWYAVTMPAADAFHTGLDARAIFGLRAGNGYDEATRLVAGRWPDNSLELPRLEVALTEVSATILRQKVGSDFTLGDGLKVRVVGIVSVVDASDPVWETEPLSLRASAPQPDREEYRAIYLTDIAGMTRVHGKGALIQYEWRYRLDPSALDMEVLPSLVAAVLDGRTQGVGGTSAETGLDTALARFADNAKAAQALFVVVWAATLATLAGLVLLASRLAVTRRRQEFALLRARGAALRTIGARTLAEAIPVVPLAALAGWYAGTLAPGRPAHTEPLVVAFAVVTLLATPLLATSSFGRVRGRLTVEIGLLILAGLGVWLLRRRGLTAELDLYLAAVPVLLAAAAAIVTLRAIPAPLALASRVAARGRGMVTFLGLARAGRSAPATVGPIAVLVVAVCTSVFSIGIAGSVAQGRDKASDQDIPADAQVEGFIFAADTAAAISALPGVTGVAPVARLPSRNLLASREVGARRLAQVYVLVVDGPTFAEVAAKAGRRAELHPVIAGARRSGVTPALISTRLAAELAGHTRAVVDLQGRDYDFEVAGVVDSFPTITRTADRFVILPWQGLPIRQDQLLYPTGFLVSGHIDPEALISAGNAGQARWSAHLTSEPVTTVKTWQQRRTELELTGVNGVLTFSYGMGALAGVVLALLAVGFAVLHGARARGKVLSRLRTMGLTRGQGRRLLLVELAPVITVAVLAGGVVGLALPSLIGPVLDLTSFTDGYEAGLRLDPWLIGGALGLIMAGLGMALIVETLFNRRLRLGEVLRLGSVEQE